MGKNNFFIRVIKWFWRELKENIISLIDLIYPSFCFGCDERLRLHEHYICTKCILDLPYTLFEDCKNNILFSIFEGRINNLEKAYSLCYFVKHSQLQHILHALKYKNAPELGHELGIHLGNEMKTINFDDFDVIIPIPLHPSRLKFRGYNQSEKIANGITEIIDAKVDITSIVRIIATQTQTKKGKLERWRNVENIFEIKNPQKLEGKHILIVDDVITTGSTIEALSREIESVLKNVRISVASVAVAKKM